jgi:predicted O-methyltransferase YrrM
MLEIGVLTGGSAILWHDYLPNTEFLSIDIEDMRTDLSKSLDRTKFFVKDAYKEETIDFLKEQEKNGFDIIIDDGPHTIDSQVYTIVNYLDLLKVNGFLFIEDIQDISWINILFASIPNKIKKNFEINFYDLRGYKNRWDDILLVIKKIK